MKVFRFKATDRTNKNFDIRIVDDGVNHAALNGSQTLCGIQMDGDDGYAPGASFDGHLTCNLCMDVVNAVTKLLEKNSDVTDSVLAAVRSRFIEIETAVNDAIEKAQVTNGSWRNEAINWANLRCAVVEFVVDEHSAFYRAIIEEASPACPSLISFVSAWLRGKGLGGVEVVTEW